MNNTEETLILPSGLCIRYRDGVEVSRRQTLPAAEAKQTSDYARRVANLYDERVAVLAKGGAL